MTRRQLYLVAVLVILALTILGVDSLLEARQRDRAGRRRAAQEVLEQTPTQLRPGPAVSASPPLVDLADRSARARLERERQMRRAERMHPPFAFGGKRSRRGA
jgi:hypothetical protein